MGLIIRNGVLYSGGGSLVNPATSDTIGAVKPDGTTITVDTDGTIHGTPEVDIDTEAPTFTEATEVSNINSGETISTLFGKIKKIITNITSHIGDTNIHTSQSEKTVWNNTNSTLKNVTAQNFIEKAEICDSVPTTRNANTIYYCKS